MLTLASVRIQPHYNQVSLARQGTQFTYIGQYEWIAGFFKSFRTSARRIFISSLLQPRTRVYTAALNPSRPEEMFSRVHAPMNID